MFYRFTPDLPWDSCNNSVDGEKTYQAYVPLPTRLLLGLVLIPALVGFWNQLGRPAPDIVTHPTSEHVTWLGCPSVIAESPNPNP